MYLFYYENRWRTGRDTSADKISHPFIELKADAYVCPEDVNNHWEYQPTQENNVKINVVCLGN